MKKIVILFFLILGYFTSFSQDILPYNKFGLKEVTIKEKEIIKDIPRLRLKTNLGKKSLVENEIKYIDNSKLKFFAPIINQRGNSCGCASGVHYIYSYELNCLLDRDGSKQENVANYMYIWNFLNGAINDGTYQWDIYDLIINNGVISEDAYQFSNFTEWVHGYKVYEKGIQNTIAGYYKLNPSYENGINEMKQYLIDHGNGSAHGGLIQFSGYAHPLEASTYAGKSNTGYKAIIPLFGTSGMHSMTICGFDDAVEWDYNNDGSISDDEKGAFLCVNTWGSDWGDNGRFYAPYKTFTDLDQGSGGTGNNGRTSFVITPKIDPVKLVFRLVFEHSSRNDIKLSIGTLQETSSTVDKSIFPVEVFKNQGGDKPLRGTLGLNKELLEISINANNLLKTDDSVYFLEIKNTINGSKGKGKLLYCSLLDYRDDPNNPKEYIAEIKNTELLNYNKLRAIVNTSLPVMEDNITSDFRYFINENTLVLNFLSKEKSYVNIDIIKDDSTINNLFNGVVNEGIESKSFELEKGSCVLRINTGNKFVYKKLLIK